MRRLHRERIRVGNDMIFYFHSRPQSASEVPLVLIHGVAGTADWWMKNVEGLNHRFEVYAPDLPGFGFSPVGAKPFDIDLEASALTQWLAAVGVTRAILVGHSMGGYLASKLALSDPRSVAALVLVDPAIFPTEYGWRRLVLGLIRAPLHLSLDIWPTLLCGLVDAGLITIFRAVRDLLTRVMLDELSAMRVPSLLIWGKHDSVVPLSVAARIKSALGNQATGPMLLSGGHIPMWDDAARFNDDVLRFLSGLGLDRP